MKIYFFISICFVSVILAFSSCRKDSPFKGKDNDIASFQLRKDAVVLKAYMLNDSIVITAPGSLSLTGFAPVIILSEHATISPDPASVTDWEQSHQFVVTSYNGAKKTYTYVMQRNIIAKDGNINLMTQADVDSLAKMKLGSINGDLIIGRPDGPDSISSLAALSDLKNISFNLVINPTYTGKDLAGLENLETIGSFLIGPDATSLQHGPVMNLTSISLPKLKAVKSNMIVNGPSITTFDLPELTNVDGNLQIAYVDSLVRIELPKLQSVLQSVIFQGNFLPNLLESINLPALENIGGDFYLTSWNNLATLKLPALKTASSVSVIGESLLTAIGAGKLQTVSSNLDISYNAGLSSLDLGSLKKVGGSFRLAADASLPNLDGIKAISEVGGNFNLEELVQLADESLESLSSLKTIGGDVMINNVPFKKFTGFRITQFQNLSIYGNDLPNITEIDLGSVDIAGKLTINHVKNGAKVTCKDMADFSVEFQNCDIALKGFLQVKDFTWSNDFGAAVSSPNLVLPLQKVANNLFIGLNSYDKLSFPALEEVGGTCDIEIYSKMLLDLPVLKKTGKAIFSLANSEIDMLTIPMLASVEGDCNFITGNGTYSITSLELPKLTRINGILNVSGQYSYGYENLKMKNLDGFSALTSVQGITIEHNLSLVDYTGLKNAIASFAADKWSVDDNAYNPSYQEMVDGKYVKP